MLLDVLEGGMGGEDGFSVCLVNLEYFWKVDDLSKIRFSRCFVISSI